MIYYKSIFSLCIFSAIFCCCTSCTERPKISDNKATNSTSHIINENANKEFYKNFTDYSLRKASIDSIMKEGDTAVYKRMYDNYLMAGYDYEFLYYAMFMANKYNYSQAYLHVYMLMDIDADTSLKNRAVLSNVALSKLKKYYLLKAFSLGNKSAIYYIEKEFGKNVDSVNISQRLKVMHRDLFEDTWSDR